MRVIVYSREKKAALDLVEAIHSLVPATKVESCASFPLCEAMLVETGTGGVVMVALVADREELASLFLFRERFMDIQLILILPEDSAATICLGHRLQPRFVGFRDNGFRDVAAVAMRLLGRMDYPCQLCN
ncbi:MAG: hypothetical protein A2512_01080 [Deltaproteobacteria bacterium RIFOXYD12_FULL_56_24]|nr:MAG: hypothetical protein A2512_01080 [Deltaproteobacteria bacterium RIFOXYD12_FULL_56_24]